MSHNDVLHLEANFTDWKNNRGAGLTDVDPFLYYGLDQLLKPFNLSDEEIGYGIVDQGNDAGVDAMYLFANRNTLIRDDIDLKSAGTSRIHVLIIQIKSSMSKTGFALDDIRKFQSFIEDLLDLGTPATSYTHKYHQNLITLMNTFKEQYTAIMAHFPELQIDFYVVTRGDETEVSPAGRDEIQKLIDRTQKLISHSHSDFHPVNTQALLEYVRKRKQTSRTIKWANPPLQTSDGYVGLVRLPDYAEFLKDEAGDLNEMIFESNVRGYQGLTAINNAMAATLSSGGPLNFWLLNNGITIITDGRTRPLTTDQLAIEDPQIVNGLQTSRKIFDYIAGAPDATDTRSVLVKVLPVANADHADMIIRATNSQNRMSSATLLATDYVHRQIEDLFKTHGLYYDRRKGFYRDQGCAAAAIVSVTELVQALVAIVQARPDTARARPSDYINRNVEYKRLFGPNQIPLPAYYKCVTIVRAIDAYFQKRRTDKGLQRNFKYYVAYVLSVHLTGRMHPSPDEIVEIDSENITEQAISRAYQLVEPRYKVLLTTDSSDGVAKGTQLLPHIKAILRDNYADEPPTRRLAQKRKPRDVVADLHRL